MSGRVSLHRRSDGGFITTIHTNTERSWVVNDEGKCSFELSLEDAKNVRQYMGARNLIYVSPGPDRLPAWGGVIEPEDSWSSRNTVEYSAFSGEALLRNRAPDGGLIKASSPGALFAKLINIANTAEDLRIRPGDIYTGGDASETTLDLTDVFEVIKEIAKRHNNNFSIDPVLDDNGRLTFAANWYQQQGTKKAIALKEGFNIERTEGVLKTQRRVVNYMTGIGTGSTDGRAVWSEFDSDSIAQYGLLQGVENFDGVSNLETLKAHTRSKLNELSQPRRTFKVIALNKEDTFSNLGKGNILPLKAFTFGWRSDGSVGSDTYIRILGMRYSDESDTCELTVDEVIE